MSPRPWYADDANTTAAWGLTPLEDQQLAGVVMWVPATLVYVEAALGVLAVWLGQMERRDVQKAQRVPPLSEARAKR